MSRLNPESGGTLSVPIVTDPPLAAPAVAPERSDKAMEFLVRCLIRTPWKCHFDITVPFGKLEMDWRRVGSTSGYALWKHDARPVAATVIFTGHDPDDCLAIERLTHAAGAAGRPIGPGFFKGLRESPRPLIGIAFGEGELETRLPITEFSIGLSKSLCRQLAVKQSRPPLGTAIPQDFPPRFLHVVVANGVIKSRMWAESKVFREVPNLQQSVTTFMDRFDDSFEKFDERIRVANDKGESRLLRIEWCGLRPTTGTAELTDDHQVRHRLLLLSGKDPADDDAVIDSFAQGLPHFVQGLFEAPLRELRSCPRPLLMELVGADPAKLDIAAGPMGQALAVAFFRRLGAF